MRDQVVLREFRNEAEAALAVATLEANGIPARLGTAQTGFYGGIAAYTSMAGPSSVIVRTEDVEEATLLLDTPADG